MSGPLYHYCNAQAFHGIVSSRKIWLSSMRMSNDSKEGMLVIDTLLEMCVDDGFSKAHMAEIEKHLRRVRSYIDGLGICLSSDGDLLSQWRGYAADGAGFSVGFNRRFLKNIVDSAWDAADRDLEMYKVEYTSKGHRRLLRPILDGLKTIVQDSSNNAGRRNSLSPDTMLNDKGKKEINDYLVKIITPAFQLKPGAFKEEREYRIIEIHWGHDALYRHSGNKIIPYVELDLSAQHDACIVHVKLGPKNPTPIDVIESFLETLGYKNVEVTTSASTYR